MLVRSVRKRVRPWGRIASFFAESVRRVLPPPWLLDMEGPKLEAFLSSERRRLLKAMSPHRQLEEVLYLEALVCRADAGETVPEAFGGHDYFTRTAPDADMPTFLRHNHKVGREEVVFDPAEAARDRASAAFGSMTPSPDHALVAYTVDDGCGEGGAIGVRRIGATHDVLEEGISTDVAAVEWASVPGARLLYYTTVDATGRPSTVHRRCMGAPERSSRTVFHEPDAGRFVDVKRTKSRQYLTVNVNDKSASEVWLVDATDPEATPELVRPREVRGSEGRQEERGVKAPTYVAPLPPARRPASSIMWSTRETAL